VAVVAQVAKVAQAALAARLVTPAMAEPERLVEQAVMVDPVI
jgi:hypothetical protein